MKLLNRTVLFTAILVASFVFSTETQAQCKRYTKKNCLPSLAPYLHNGQLTSAVLNPGNTADIKLTFNAGKEYRVLLCSQEQIGKVQFIVLDKQRRMLYKSDPETTNPYWDFKVENTQQLIVKIVVPPMEKSNQKTNLMPNGCVSLLVGFKK